MTVERALTIYLNGQEIVTAMTINDYPEYLAIGFLLNQNMLLPDDVVTGVDYDDDLSVAVVRTERQTDYEEKMRKRTQTSGCARGHDFRRSHGSAGRRDVIGCRATDIVAFTRSRMRSTRRPRFISRPARSTVVCWRKKTSRWSIWKTSAAITPSIKSRGWMFQNKVPAHDKIFYTTGRLTSEMCDQDSPDGDPTFVSRSGFTAWGR